MNFNPCVTIRVASESNPEILFSYLYLKHKYLSHNSGNRNISNTNIIERNIFYMALQTCVQHTLLLVHIQMDVTRNFPFTSLSEKKQLYTFIFISGECELKVLHIQSTGSNFVYHCSSTYLPLKKSLKIVNIQVDTKSDRH